MDIIRQLEAEQAAKIEAKRTLPEFQPGDTVRVQVRVTEGTRTRVQAYEGVVIARAGAGFQENFTVRKISYGEGVERVFPVYSPMVEGVEIVRRGKVRRAKLYYLRDRRGKSARISENTGVRARKLNDAEREALDAEKAAHRGREGRRRRGACRREGRTGRRREEGSCRGRKAAEAAWPKPRRLPSKLGTTFDKGGFGRLFRFRSGSMGARGEANHLTGGRSATRFQLADELPKLARPIETDTVCQSPRRRTVVCTLRSGS